MRRRDFFAVAAVGAAIPLAGAVEAQSMTQAQVIAAIRSAANALVLGSITQAQKDALVALVDQLVVDSGDASQGVVLNYAPNVASGAYSGVGGASSTASGTGSFAWGIGAVSQKGGAAMGRNVLGTSNDAFVTGQATQAHGDNGIAEGWANLSTGEQAHVTGHQSNDRGINGARAYASGSFRNTGDEGIGKGDAQRIELLLRVITTDATPKQLSSSSYNVVASISPEPNVLTIPTNGSLRVEGGVVARDQFGASASWKFSALVKKLGTTPMLVGASVLPEFADGGAAWGFNVSADTSMGSLALTATGQAGRTIQWVARIISTENVGV